VNSEFSELSEHKHASRVKLHCFNFYHPDLILHLQGQVMQLLNIMMFVSVFYTMGHVDCYTGGHSELYHKCVADIQ
jgi:hypothetical protein